MVMKHLPYCIIIVITMTPLSENALLIVKSNSNNKDIELLATMEMEENNNIQTYCTNTSTTTERRTVEDSSLLVDTSTCNADEKEFVNALFCLAQSDAPTDECTNTSTTCGDNVDFWVFEL